MPFSKSHPALILALFTLIFVHGCSNQAPEKSITQFWTWFAQDYATAPVFSRTDKADADTNKITKKLQTINRGLSAQIAVSDEKKQNLIISAGGNKKLFPLVREIVKEAPELPAWNVIALKPQVERLAPVESDGIVVSPEDIFFTIQAHDGVVDICVLLDHTIPHANAEKIAILMLDQSLGEYEASEKIGKITFAPITELNEDNSNFRELRKAVDDYCK